MTMIDVWLAIDGNQVAHDLNEAGEKLGSGGDASLDFTSVHRLDPSGLRALEDFAAAADQKAVKATLRGVNVDIYKVLKLARMTSRFSFVN